MSKQYGIEEIIDYLDSCFPRENKCEYDNVGLMVGSRKGSTQSVVLSLDTTSSAIELCKEKEAHLLIVHHPLLFGGIDCIDVDNVVGLQIKNLLENEIVNFACHTNLDNTDEFGNLAIASSLGSSKAEHLDGVECGVVFELDNSVVLKEYMSTVTKSLDSSGVISISDTSRSVKKIFVQGGSFDENSVDVILREGIDTVVSGEIKHHICLYLEQNGVSTIIAGHNATERTYLPKLKGLLNGRFEDLDIFVDFGNESNT